MIALNSSPCIPQQYFNTFLTAQLFFVGSFYSQFSYEVAGDVLFIIFHLRLGHFADISQDMCTGIIVILPDGTPLDVESGKLEKLFLEDTTVFSRELGEQHLVGVRRVAGI